MITTSTNDAKLAPTLNDKISQDHVRTLDMTVQLVDIRTVLAIDSQVQCEETVLSDFVMHSDDTLPSTSVTHVQSDVVFVPSDLSSYRNRIDASVDEQRKYRQVLANLSNKVKKCRQYTAKSLAQLNAPLSDIDVTSDGVHVLSRSHEMLHVRLNGLSANSLFSSIFTDTGLKTESPGNSNDVIIQQLRDERLRNDRLEDLNDIYREQTEAVLQTNKNLEDELLKAQGELVKVAHERELEQYFLRQNDERRKRAMDTHYQHMLELWVAFNRLRRQVRDLRTETESDLDRQRTEFVRCANNMEAFVRQAEMKRKHAELEEKKDDGTVNDLLKKYEDMAVRSIKLEHTLNDSSRRVVVLEGLLKKAHEERDAAKDSLGKIRLIPELDEMSSRRTRSVSPVRLVRTGLQKKNNEINDYKRKCREYEDKLAEREKRLTRLEESRRKNDEEFVDTKKENDKLRRDKEEIERKYRRLNERFERLDSEKVETQKAIEQLQNEIHSLNVSHQETLSEVLRKQQEELTERRKYFEDELQERDTDNAQRLSVLKCELEKYRNEVGELRDQLRNAQADSTAERNRLVEKENIILEHQLALRNLRDENRNVRIANDEKDIQIIELQRHIDESELEVKQRGERLSALQNEKSVLVAENASLLADINTLRANVTENRSMMEQNEEALENAVTKISEITKQLQERDQKILLLEKAVTEYELRIDSANEQSIRTRAEQAMKGEEFERSAAKILALNQEKATLLKERLDLENELRRISYVTVELEKKVADLEKCIESHIIQEGVLHDFLEQYKVKEREASQLLADSKLEIARLSEINERIKSEHSALLKRVHHEYEEIQREVIIQKKKEVESCDDIILALRKNKKYLEKSLTETEGRATELSLRCENLELEKENLRVRLEAEKERCEKETNSLRQQLDAIKERYIEETAEWEKILTEKDSSYNLKVLEMDINMKALHDKLHQSQEAEFNLKREVANLNIRIDRKKDAVKWTQSEISKKDEELKSEMAKLDQERCKWNEKVRLKDIELAEAHCHIQSLRTKCLELEKTLQSVESRLNKKTQNLSIAENELEQVEDLIALHMKEQAALKSSLADNEREKNDLKAERDKLKVSLQEVCAQAEVMKSEEEVLRKEIRMMESKLQDEGKRIQKLSNDMRQLENENSKLEIALSEKSSDLSALSVLFKQSENNQKRAIEKLEKERQKSYETEKVIAALQDENGKLSHDLIHTRDVLEQKIAANQQAMDVVIANYKAAEKSRTDAIHQKEAVFDEMSNLKNLLAAENAKRMLTEQKLAESEMMRKVLIKKLTYFETNARRLLSFTKARSLSPFRSCVPKVEGKIMSQNHLQQGKGSLRRSSSAFLSPHPRFDLNYEVQSSNLESLNINSSAEIMFRHLKDRIKELEQAEAHESGTLIRLKADKEEVSQKNRKYQDKIRLLEQKIIDLEQDKRLLESRLSSSRQLLVAQEVSLQAQETERNALKTRVVSADLHVRDKDARLSFLNEQVAGLKAELAAVENERKKLEKSRIMWEEERVSYESACREAEEKVQQYCADMKSVISGKEKLEEQLNEAEHLLVRTQKHCAELEKANREYKNMLEKGKIDESLGDQRKQDDHTKISDSNLLSKLSVLQHEYDNSLLQLEASNLEKQSLKNELEEAGNRQKEACHRIATIQQKLDEVLAEKNFLQERLNIMEKLLKREKKNQQMEKDKCAELEKLRAEKVALLAESEELKRLLSKAEAEHREFDAYYARLERERLALKRNIEKLEVEKQHKDAAMRQITFERHALDKSLTTMEKENMELYRNCTQLRNQVVQLEKESSSHLVEESAVRLKELENKLVQAQRERQQIEQLLEQRESAFAHKIKILESNIVALKGQLSVERERRLEVVERTAVVQRGQREMRLYRQVRRRETTDSKN